MTYTIVSGGQDGADLAAWKAARVVSFPTAGWMPRDFKTESAYRPEYAALYNARETRSPGYDERRQLNIQQSDATIIFRSTRVKSSPGSDRTKAECGQFKKPAIVIPVWGPPGGIISPIDLAEKIRHHKFRTINIAGTRASSDPGEPGKYWTSIEGFTFSFCLALFEILKESEA